MPKIRKRNIRRSFKNSIKYLRKEEWDRLRGSIDNYGDKLIVILLYATGMRVGEFTKLMVENIDFEERFLKIPAENTKTREARTIHVPREVLSDIRAYLKLEKKKGRLLDLTPRRVQQLLKKYSSWAGVEAIPPHAKTHSYCPFSLG